MLANPKLKLHATIRTRRLVPLHFLFFLLVSLTTVLAQKAPDGADLFAASFEAGSKTDADRALTRSSFYSPTEDHTIRMPGALLKSEPAGEFVLPAGVSATRILYHTRTADNQDALASGVVLVPYGQPPPGGWPVLAWSHGTSGVATACAPSLMRTLFYNWEGLYEYVMLGYAVVATDYAGLGTPGRHAYLDMLSNGRDVIYSIPAARVAVPSLGPKWIAIGHSQGGLSVLGVAELEADIHDPNFLGTVSLAGASDLDDALQAVEKTNVPALNGLVAFWVFGMKTLYPQLQVSDVLSDKALAVYNESVENGCSAASGAFSALATDEILKKGWNENPYVQRSLSNNRPGAKPIYGPLLLVSGGADPIFTEAASRTVMQRLCSQGGEVQRTVYPGLGHDALVFGSLRQQLDWISARFLGEQPPTSCHR